MQQSDRNQDADREPQSGAAAAQPESQVEPERDRRGVALPAKQRVGGIITPQ